MPQFSPDVVDFKDMAGYGAFDMGHMREHLQFVQVLSQANPPILIPDFDFLQFLTAGPERKSIVESHAQAHVLLRAAMGITGTDLSAVNLDDNGSFNDWLSYHRDEHALIRQTLGIV
jgi:hypothetical protein